MAEPIFYQGLVYVSVQDGQVNQFFYPDRSDVFVGYKNFHCIHIANMHLGKGRPDSGGFRIFSQNGRHDNPELILTDYRAATDEDLSQLFLTWDSPISIKHWLLKVKKKGFHWLLETERQRILRIGEKFL